jgi:hypothetical protein
MQKQFYFNSLILLLTSAIWGFSIVAQRKVVAEQAATILSLESAFAMPGG